MSRQAIVRQEPTLFEEKKKKKNEPNREDLEIQTFKMAKE